MFFDDSPREGDCFGEACLRWFVIFFGVVAQRSEASGAHYGEPFQNRDLAGKNTGFAETAIHDGASPVVGEGVGEEPRQVSFEGTARSHGSGTVRKVEGRELQAESEKGLVVLEEELAGVVVEAAERSVAIVNFESHRARLLLRSGLGFSIWSRSFTGDGRRILSRSEIRPRLWMTLTRRSRDMQPSRSKRR